MEGIALNAMRLHRTMDATHQKWREDNEINGGHDDVDFLMLD